MFISKTWLRYNRERARTRIPDINFIRVPYLSWDRTPDAAIVHELHVLPACGALQDDVVSCQDLRRADASTGRWPERNANLVADVPGILAFTRYATKTIMLDGFNRVA